MGGARLDEGHEGWERPVTGSSGHAARLTRRAEFVSVAKGRRFHMPALTLQSLAREDAAMPGPGPARVGLTITRKEGTAVERNRMRRRLRALLRTDPDLPLRAGHDYVIVARRNLLQAPFEMIGAQLRNALEGVQAKRRKDAAPRTPAS